MPRTKIVCTIGPSSQDEATLRAMIRAGMDVARINFSHGDHKTHARNIALVRRLAEEEGQVVAVMGDLQGPKIRIGDLPGGQVRLERAEKVVLSPHPHPLPQGAIPTKVGIRSAQDDTTPSPSSSPPRGRGAAEPLRGMRKVIPLPHPQIFKLAKAGDRILLGDGEIELVVRESRQVGMVAEVVSGGVLRSRQGVHLAGADLGLSPITEKDREDLKFALEQGVDYIALSFVREKRDIEELRELMGKKAVPVIAKIETKQAVANFPQILESADAVMVARGDLGVEIPAAEVPIVQKEIIRQANIAAVPVITATQMLNSMVSSPRPTRAEASDVANAILDGTDACMLSAETAVGAYPVEAVKTMQAIALAAEQKLPYRRLSRIGDNTPSPYPSPFIPIRSGQGGRGGKGAGGGKPHPSRVTDAVSQASCEVARDLGAVAIITTTSSGYTARMVARHRPPLPIIAVTSQERVYRRLALVWGVEPMLVEKPTGTDELIALSINAAKERGIAKQGDIVVITAGVPHGVPGRTNMIQVQVVG